MCRTTHCIAWLLFSLAVTTSSACGGDKDGGSAGSGGAGSGAGGSGSGGTSGSTSARAGSGDSSSGRGGSGAAAGQAGASGVRGADEGDDDSDAGMSPGGRGGSGGTAAEGGRGGASGSGAASGSGGASGSVGAFGNGGTSGDAGESVSGGAGGGASGSGGSGGASGSGASGSGGSGGGPDDGDVDEAAVQCVRDAEAAGQTITDCETCLCMSDNCQAEMNAIKDDVKANALATCGKENACAGQCCLCSTDGQGDTCGIQNYGTGVCADEVESAAGAMPGAGLLNAAAVMTNCTDAGPADNSCARVTRLVTCASAKCASECPRVVVSCPPG